MNNLFYLIDVLLVILCALVGTIKVITKEQITVSNIVVLYSVTLIFTHDFFGFIGNIHTLLMLFIIPIILFWFIKLLAYIFKLITKDVKDYNQFIQWFG